jgi:hypothetical protein
MKEPVTNQVLNLNFTKMMPKNLNVSGLSISDVKNHTTDQDSRKINIDLTSPFANALTSPMGAMTQRVHT